MINSELSHITSIALHRVGNKLNEEGIQFSKELLETNDEINEILLSYFLTPFKINEFYNFICDNDFSDHEMFKFVSEIFDNPQLMHDRSVDIAKRLYECSVHPKIKKGEFCVAYIKDCIIEDETVDALGLFKSEIKEKYLKVVTNEEGFEIYSDDGINVNKLDKGCLIFNTEKEKGFKIMIVDNINRGDEARYWKDDFLKVEQRKDDFYHTQNIMSMCKSFFTEYLPEEHHAEKADQADLLNKSVKFLKEKESFNLDEFANEVIEKPGLIKDFKKYKSDFETNFDVELPENFHISEPVIKKNSKVFKSVIKLDKNFHIYIHGKREYIMKGYDEKSGLHFYQLFYKEEL
ncbi:MAG: nucleoid-associated protein [Bacteroidales bacterium]|nr:nucleoid-associated protein [Bacteroidales bacterium]